jgi:hypothetical protein
MFALIETRNVASRHYIFLPQARSQIQIIAETSITEQAHGGFCSVVDVPDIELVTAPKYQKQLLPSTFLSFCSKLYTVLFL